MDYGTSKRVLRDKLPVQVPIGFNPTEPVKLSSLAPSIDDEAIYEGMVLKKTTGTVGGVASQTGFAKAVDADQDTDVTFYIATHDGDSHDVQASGKLVGLDCSDKFEIQTGYFDTTETWAVDDPLTVGTGGILIKAAGNDGVTVGPGVDQRIVGYVTAVGDGIGNSIAYVGKTPSCAVADAVMLQFKTAQNGQFFPAVAIS